jgi:hypothetical protein
VLPCRRGFSAAELLNPALLIQLYSLLWLLQAPDTRTLLFLVLWVQNESPVMSRRSPAAPRAIQGRSARQGGRMAEETDCPACTSGEINE